MVSSLEKRVQPLKEALYRQLGTGFYAKLMLFFRMGMVVGIAPMQIGGDEASHKVLEAYVLEGVITNGELFAGGTNGAGGVEPAV